MNRKVFNKVNPSSNGNTFIPLPSDAKHYVHHPKIRPNMLFLYALIIDFYNVDLGYAFPSLEELSVHYGVSKNTTPEHIKALKEVGLIDFPSKGHYVPLAPLPKDEFYKEFPEAWEAYKKTLSSSGDRRIKGKERLREWREKKGYIEE